MTTNLNLQKIFKSILHGEIILVIIIVLGIVLRLQNFHILPFDGHAMRQTDTESVAYNFAFINHNILYPQNSLIRPITNTKAYFFLEFPAYQYLIGLFYRLFGWHIEIARIINIFLYIISSFSLYYISSKLFHSKVIATFSTFFFIFAPGSIFFLGHAIHPDIFAICMYLVSLSTFLHWNKNKKTPWIITSLISLSLSVATRPFILIGLPAYFYLIWLKKNSYWMYPTYLIGATLLYGTWKLWQIPFTSANSSWENWVLGGRHELFKYEILINRLIFKNIIGEVMGKVTTFFAGLAIITYLLKQNKELIFIFVWLAFVPIYWLIVPNGNIVHQYYANIYIIPVVMLAGYGLNQLLQKLWNINKYLSITITILTLSITIYNGYHTSNYYFSDVISVNEQQIAKELNQVIPNNAKIVYLAINNSIPFSLNHIQGWMLGSPPMDVNPTATDILSMKDLGAEFIVAANDNTDLNQTELLQIQQNTKLIYSSPWIQVYKYL